MSPSAPPRPPTVLLVGCLCFVAAGCNDDVEIASGLGERQVNRLLVQLHQHEVTSARSERDRRAGKRFHVLVAPAEETRARELLERYDLPEREDTGLAARFDPQALVPSPTAERARLMVGLGEMLSQTLEQIDGVIRARVHVMLPADADLTLLARNPDPPTASVLLLCTSVSSGTTQPTDARAPRPIAEEEVQRLVSGAVEDLRPEAVTVVYSFTQVPAGPSPGGNAHVAAVTHRPAKHALLLVFLAVVGTLAATIAVMSLRRHGPLST